MVINILEASRAEYYLYDYYHCVILHTPAQTPPNYTQQKQALPSRVSAVLFNLTNILNNLTVLLQVCSDISSASLKQIQPLIENIANFNKLFVKKVLQF